MQAVDGACPYCGAAAPAAVAVAPAPDPAAGRESALAAVRAHPSFDSIAREVPPLPGLVHVMYVMPIIVGIVFTAVPVVIALVTGVFAGGLSGRWELGIGVALAVAVFASLFLLMGIGVIVMGVRTRRKLLGGPVRAVPAVVLAKRTEPGGKATSYYVTLGFEGGERQEFGTLDGVFRSAFEGDVGVAHCRGELLLGLREVGTDPTTEVS
jgi:hypothetical protein